MGDVTLYTEQAKRFKEKYEPELYKPYEVIYDESVRGSCEEKRKRFIIRLCPSLRKESPAAHDANFCHELYHAVQISKGFPVYSTSHNISTHDVDFLSALRTVLLDMDVNDNLSKEKIDCFHFFNERINYMCEQCDKGLAEVQNRYEENMFALKLLLFYSHTEHSKSKRIKRDIEQLNPYISQCVKALEGIVSVYGYNTPEKAFCSLGHFLTHFNLWDSAGILFNGLVCTSQDVFNQRCIAICQ